MSGWPVFGAALMLASLLVPDVPGVLRWLAPVAGLIGIVVMFAFLGQQYFGLGRGIAERITVSSVPAWLALLAAWVTWDRVARPGNR